jgi:hypothetical protein
MAIEVRPVGAMRLTTIERRTGRAHPVIVGYLEDGPNLVTMAMNGWDDAEPAWWLNLQAHPIAGFRAFLALNRCVRKGERAIRILAPFAVKERDEHGEETGAKRIFFRSVPVFDTLSRDGRWVA